LPATADRCSPSWSPSAGANLQTRDRRRGRRARRTLGSPEEQLSSTQQVFPSGDDSVSGGQMTAGSQHQLQPAGDAANRLGSSWLVALADDARAPVGQPNTAGDVNGFRERRIGRSTG
jgi:hypothetical protein